MGSRHPVNVSAREATVSPLSRGAISDARRRHAMMEVRDARDGRDFDHGAAQKIAQPLELGDQGVPVVARGGAIPVGLPTTLSHIRPAPVKRSYRTC
jgi:hypothetical protein